jgi:hypothetical protein
MNAKISLVFMMIVYPAIITINLSSAYYQSRRPVFYREVLRGYYLPEAYSIAISFIELPWSMLTVLVFASTSYFMAGLDPDGSVFGTHILAMFLQILTFVYCAQVRRDSA